MVGNNKNNYPLQTLYDNFTRTWKLFSFPPYISVKHFCIVILIPFSTRHVKNYAYIQAYTKHYEIGNDAIKDRL